MPEELEPSTVGTPLVFVGRLDEADAAFMRRYHDLLLIGRPVRWAGGVVLTLLAAVAVWWTLAWGEFEWWSWLVAAWFVAAWSLLLLLIPPVRGWEARRHYRKHAADYLETRVSLGDNRVEIENPMNASSFQWKAVGLVADTPEGLLFCNQALQVFFWLPERVLSADHLRERVLALVRVSGVSVRRLG